MDILSVRNQIKREGINFKDLPLRVAFYARVSTDFLEQLNSLENQKQYFTEYIGDMPNWEFAGGYIDEGISGVTTKKREKFNEMIDDALSGQFEMVSIRDIFVVGGVFMAWCRNFTTLPCPPSIRRAHKFPSAAHHKRNGLITGKAKRQPNSKAIHFLAVSIDNCIL